MNPIVAVALIIGAALLSVLGFLLVSRLVPQRWLVADTDAAGAIFATIGMVYAILTAIAAIAVWEPRSAAEQNTEMEAASLAEAHWSANSLPDRDRDRDRDRIQETIVAYLDEAATVEWQQLRTNQRGSATADQLFLQLRQRGRPCQASCGGCSSVVV